MIFGIDFDGYTIFNRDSISPGKQVDFVICGVAWGSRINPTWEFNKPEIMKEDRRLIYSFFNRDDPWEKQADVFLRELEDVKAHLAMFDWERSYYGVSDSIPIGPQARNIWKIIEKVKANYDGKRLWYSNMNDYWLAQDYIPIDTMDWCIADPDGAPDIPPGNTAWWSRVNRPLGDYQFHQYDHHAYAPDYGAVNNKKDMDLQSFQGTRADLDAYLGIIEPRKRARMNPRIRPR